MNFGERLKQIRTDKGLTQPQFAAMAGIDQSYLSKLENDKSVPSSEMFGTIVAALEMDAAAFLAGIDREVLASILRHIPQVTQFSNGEVAAQVQHTKRWLFGSAAAWILGFAMMLAANDGIFFSNKLYRYVSQGVLYAGESQDILDSYVGWFTRQRDAKLITPQDMEQQVAAFRDKRIRLVTVETPHSRGTTYQAPEGQGYRQFDLQRTTHVQAPGNRILQYLGAIVLLSGFVGLFIEWRLRRLKHKLR
ncbi:helix-turn-helix domain-containing protein [Massilia yuzhufengensis]|uniref:Helix-turn-helix domain-containing protein n=1 Tax=Massilia yuzhufengensis TaxID=1164594 RepID=A0A1I1KR15_9BURK|nr:helix-turn-helix transcriptional regulator [Massilia yuzhufengensis]SFC63171.1 Helix-turn-helix domain-containing protein [Massilia yuzhufengensis]